MQPSLQAPVSVNVTLALPSSALCSITAVSRVPNTMEVWWVGTDASVRDAFWYAPSHPQNKRPRRPQDPGPRRNPSPDKKPAQGKAYRESAIGPKQTSASAPHMSAFGGKADMAYCGKSLSQSLLGVKRTWPIAVQMSAFDPKRKSQPPGETPAERR